MGYRLSPPFSQLVVRKYDITGSQRLTLDNFIQVSVAQRCCVLAWCCFLTFSSRWRHTMKRCVTFSGVCAVKVSDGHVSRPRHSTTGRRPDKLRRLHDHVPTQQSLTWTLVCSVRVLASCVSSRKLVLPQTATNGKVAFTNQPITTLNIGFPLSTQTSAMLICCVLCRKRPLARRTNLHSALCIAWWKENSQFVAASPNQCTFDKEAVRCLQKFCEICNPVWALGALSLRSKSEESSWQAALEISWRRNSNCPLSLSRDILDRAAFWWCLNIISKRNAMETRQVSPVSDFEFPRLLIGFVVQFWNL